MSNTPEAIDVLGIKVPAKDFSPPPMDKTYHLKKPANFFYTPDQRATRLFLLHQGGAVLTYQQSRKGFIIPTELLIGPTCFGEESFRRSPGCYRDFAEPLRSSTVTVVDRHLRDKLYSHPGVRDRLEEEFMTRKGNQGVMQAALVTKPVLSRLATVLPMLAIEEQVRGAQFLSVPLRHHQLAMVVGSTRESVTTSLGELRNRKLISLNGGGVILLDQGLDQLRDLAAQEKF